MMKTWARLHHLQPILWHRLLNRRRVGKVKTAFVVTTSVVSCRKSDFVGTTSVVSCRKTHGWSRNYSRYYKKISWVMQDVCYKTGEVLAQIDADQRKKAHWFACKKVALMQSGQNLSHSLAVISPASSAKAKLSASPVLSPCISVECLIINPNHNDIWNTAPLPARPIADKLPFHCR